jgi:hypothetical protein
VYPRHEARADAEKAFAKLDPSEDLLAEMIRAIERQKQRGCLQPRTTEDGRSTIPYPATWLNKRRWTDELPAGQPAPSPPDSTDDLRERKRQYWQKLVKEGNYTLEEAEAKFGGPLW